MIINQFFLIVILSFIPSAGISLLLIYRNKEKGLKPSLYLKSMLWGALSVLAGIIIVPFSTSFMVNRGWYSFFVKPIVAVALVEETIKLIVLLALVFRKKIFRTVHQGIYYSVSIALGFAFAENIIYLTGNGSPLQLILWRSLTTLPIHGLCGAFMGYFIGLAKEREKSKTAQALIFPVIIHGIYNIMISLNYPYYLLSIILILFSFFLLKVILNKK